jgi:hypothetical protein
MSEAKICLAKSNNLYQYFDRYCGYMKTVMNQHEIDKAILSVIGERQFDKRIREIWDRVLEDDL